ncbi:MAG: VOC family protein [Bacteroidota bacterium]
MLRLAVPILHVASSTAAESFYRQLGFEAESRYRPVEAQADPCYLVLVRDDVRVHLSSFPGDSVAGGAVNLYVSDVDALHNELAASGLATEMEPTDQSWGTREVYVTDPDGNSLRFVHAPAL